MMNGGKVNILENPAISAIYYGLLQSGYDLYAKGWDEKHAAQVGSFVNPGESIPFFEQARQATCEDYPYWPRAVLLEEAVSFLTPEMDGYTDFAALRRHIEDMPNVKDEERGGELWRWLEEFPQALRQVMDSRGFREYMRWEQTWVQRQKEAFSTDLRKMEEVMQAYALQYPDGVQRISIVLCPIKSRYVIDHFSQDDALTFTVSLLRAPVFALVYFRRLIQPVVEELREDILQHPREYPMLDVRYREGDSCAAFAEYAAQELLRQAFTAEAPRDLTTYLRTLIQSE